MRIGIDLGGTKVEGIVLRPDGTVVARIRQPSPRDDYAGTINVIKDLTLNLEQKAGVSCTVGIGIPGTISTRTNLVKNANSTWLIGKPLRDDLQAALQRDVKISNDANCFALSEAEDGAAAGAHTVFGVILGTGVGGGLVIDGNVIDGPNGIAGEWGHNPLPWPDSSELPGRACYCGKNGCIETFLSGPGLAADYQSSGGDAVSAEVLVTMEGSLVDAALQRYEIRLAKALASIINVLDPHVIVLGGGLSNIARLYETVPALLSRWVFSDTVETELRPPKHGDSSGVRGAAWLWPDNDG